MGQAYKIDKPSLITYKGQKKKAVNSLHCRYIAKSQVINCTAQSQSFEYINFRGSHFKKVNFKNTTFYGCDFWGTTFAKCDFQNARFIDCVFMASKFKTCHFSGARFNYSTIVNTNLSDCLDIDISSGVVVYKTYPKCDISPELADALTLLKNNRNLKKSKLLFVSDHSDPLVGNLTPFHVAAINYDDCNEYHNLFFCASQPQSIRVCCNIERVHLH